MKSFFYAAILLLIATSGVLWFLYNKTPKDIARSQPAFSVSADSLYKEFSRDENKANERYLDQLVEVTGKVNEINNFKGNNSILLSTTDPLFGINCSFSDLTEIQKLEVDDSVKIKGICTGMLSDVVLIKCSLKKVIK